LQSDSFALGLRGTAERSEAEPFAISDHDMEPTLVLDVLEKDTLADRPSQLGLVRQPRRRREIACS
jgi:hypothetical protein